MSDTHINFSYSSVQVGSGVISSNIGTDIVVATGDGTLYGADMNVVVYPHGVPALKQNAEIMRVTGVAGDTLTVVRAQENTTALTGIAAGYQVVGAITAKLFTDLEAAIGSGSGGVSESNAIAYAIALG